MAARDIPTNFRGARRVSGPGVRRAPRSARSAPADARLVARIRAGDEQAFEAVYDRYHRQLLAFCRHMLGTREEAEDALQHVLVSAHKQPRSPTATLVDLRPWLYAIARNRCLSMLRARRESSRSTPCPSRARKGSARRGGRAARGPQGLLADLARLPDDQRAALVLAELGALSHDEIADVLGVRRDKVKALVFQARESLAGWRQARDTDCRVIREQLATLAAARCAAGRCAGISRPARAAATSAPRSAASARPWPCCCRSSPPSR